MANDLVLMILIFPHLILSHPYTYRFELSVIVSNCLWNNSQVISPSPLSFKGEVLNLLVSSICWSLQFYSWVYLHFSKGTKLFSPFLALAYGCARSWGCLRVLILNRSVKSVKSGWSEYFLRGQFWLCGRVHVSLCSRWLLEVSKKEVCLVSFTRIRLTDLVRLPQH